MSDTRTTPDAALQASEIAQARSILDGLEAGYARSVIGQEGLRRSLIVSLLAGGHILLESLPGLAKTTAAHTLATLLDASFARIQCTPDLLPSDITGTQIYDARTADFRTQLGPVHANVVLLDEINRSSAKTQSAMLEAMQERRVTIGGVTHALPTPFMVIATQNPIEQEGTYPLPEAQLDRFLLKEVIDYPEAVDELDVLRQFADGTLADPATAEPLIDRAAVQWLQDVTRRVHVSDAVLRYALTIVAATRDAAAYIGPERARYIECGASPRGGLSFVAAARALAVIHGRDHVLPEDVAALRHLVLRHRVLLHFDADADGVRVEDLIDAIVSAVQTP
ncbi:AAA family ATPase [Cellulomonas timonensis]|uniref:AAA family ATPase n=1 Tax=Cellulomonas timonensis TaxID=1689271 RepID=UPI00082B3B6B|nr:AAA family ATPase [Cellulomonas timonensis]